MSATIEAQRVCDELTLAQVHDALGYYYDHPCEIEQYIAENKAALNVYDRAALRSPVHRYENLAEFAGR